MVHSDRALLIEAASAILAVHVETAGGFCHGCETQWDRLIPASQCPQVAWAIRVLDAYHISVADPPPSNLAADGIFHGIVHSL